MWMLQCILCVSFEERKLNENIRQSIGTTCITDKTQEARLWQYDQIQCREDRSYSRCDIINAGKYIDVAEHWEKAAYIRRDAGDEGKWRGRKNPCKWPPVKAITAWVRKRKTFVNAWWRFVLDASLTPVQRHRATNLNKWNNVVCKL